MKIGFIYYNFYPVTGGASVHGYQLAKELTKQGFTLYKLNGQADPYTIRLDNRLTGLFRILKTCDLIYIRLDYFLNLRNLIAPLALLAGKKIVVELNSPADELHLFNKNRKQIERAGRLMGYFLKKAAAIIVVSEPVKEYCEKKLHAENVFVVENGGEIFEPDLQKVSEEIKNQIGDIREKFSKLIVWAGSINEMQDFELLQKIAVSQQEKAAFLLVVNEENEESFLDNLPANVFLFKNVLRDDVSFIITSADIGLAFYGDYSWSESGFYNNSLKVYEYLNNGLLTISNKPGSAIQKEYNNFKFAGNEEEILTLIENFKPPVTIGHTIRTWAHVAEETSNIIHKVIDRDK